MKYQDQQRGMALFVTLVVVMILFVVIYQLWHCSVLEIRIAHNQGGYMKSSLAIQSMVPYAITLLQEDLRKDVEAGQGGSLTSALGGSSQGVMDLSGLTGTNGGKPGQSSQIAGAGKLGSPSPGAAATGGIYDSINEALFKTRTQSINDVSLKIEIVDCERKINLNKIFDYVSLWRRAKEGVGKLGDGTPGEATGTGSETSKSNNQENKAGSNEDLTKNLSSQDKDRLNEILGPSGGLPQDSVDENEWVEPDQEQVEAAEKMVADIIINMVETNITDNGLQYKRLYNADEVSRAIINYIIARKSDESQNFIFDVSELLQIEEVTPELFYGPVPLELSDPEAKLGKEDEGFRRDEFGDLVYKFGNWNDFNQDSNSADSGFGSSMGSYGNFNDFQELKDEFGLSGSLRPGITSLSGSPFPDNDEGTGILRPPKSIGLKDLFCTFSNGKINLNTAPMEVIMALLQGGDQTGNAWDPDKKLEIASAIVYWRDQYTEDYLQELEDQENDPSYADQEDENSDFNSMFGTEDLPTNIYKSIQDLNKIKIDDKEILKDSQIDSGGTEQSPSMLVKKDLTPCSVFKSEFFEVRIVAQGKGFRQEAVFVVHRDLNNKTFSIVNYKECQD